MDEFLVVGDIPVTNVYGTIDSERSNKLNPYSSIQAAKNLEEVLKFRYPNQNILTSYSVKRDDKEFSGDDLSEMEKILSHEKVESRITLSNNSVDINIEYNESYKNTHVSTAKFFAGNALFAYLFYDSMYRMTENVDKPKLIFTGIAVSLAFSLFFYNASPKLLKTTAAFKDGREINHEMIKAFRSQYKSLKRNSRPKSPIF